MIVDESHQSVPQVRGMYHGDRQRKTTLVEYGFRLPSALDNRPLSFEEFEERLGQVVYVSATPGPYELQKAGGVVVEQVIRPTGLTDPPVVVRPVKGGGRLRPRFGSAWRGRAGARRRSPPHGRHLTSTTTTRRSACVLIRTRDPGARPFGGTAQAVAFGGNQPAARGLDRPDVSLVAILDAARRASAFGRFAHPEHGTAARTEGRAILYATDTDS